MSFRYPARIIQLYAGALGLYALNAGMVWALLDGNVLVDAPEAAYGLLLTLITAYEILSAAEEHLEDGALERLYGIGVNLGGIQCGAAVLLIGAQLLGTHFPQNGPLFAGVLAGVLYVAVRKSLMATIVPEQYRTDTNLFVGRKGRNTHSSDRIRGPKIYREPVYKRLTWYHLALLGVNAVILVTVWKIFGSGTVNAVSPLYALYLLIHAVWFIMPVIGFSRGSETDQTDAVVHNAQQTTMVSAVADGFFIPLVLSGIVIGLGLLDGISRQIGVQIIILFTASLLVMITYVKTIHRVIRRAP